MKESLSAIVKIVGFADTIIVHYPLKKELFLTAPFDHVVFINFSRHLGQVMEIFPFPLGTLTC